MDCKPTCFVTTLFAAAVAALLCIAAGCASAGGNGTAPEFWNRLEQGGTVLILPHAGPSGRTRSEAEAGADSCGTQNHLSDDDKLKLQNLKNQMRSHDVSIGRVLASHDCRCIQTAGILFGQAQPWSIVDDNRQIDRKLADQRRAALLEAVSRWDSDDNVSIVTHQATIREAFGIDMAPAELLLIEPLGDEGFRIIGRLGPD